MKERPILFSGPMVRAILDGRKTQTRRVVKGVDDHYRLVEDGKVWNMDECGDYDVLPCPFGVPGDRLWVREAARVVSVSTGGKPWYSIEYAGGGPDLVRQGELPGPWFPSRAHDVVGKPLWCPSIHMPRWACRTVLEVVSVRVERLQEISEGDAIAEGVDDIDGEHMNSERFSKASFLALVAGKHGHSYVQRHRAAFWHLWESINGGGSWKLNPWVWVVEFKRSEAAR